MKNNVFSTAYEKTEGQTQYKLKTSPKSYKIEIKFLPILGWLNRALKTPALENIAMIFFLNHRSVHV